jgi:hypothetical protein
MKITINPKEFINHFINPINDLNKEGKISIFTDENVLYSVSTTKSRTIHLYNTYQPLSIIDPVERCSLNITRLIKGLQCVNSEESFISLDISPETGNLSFSTEDIKFNVRLLDDNLVNVPKFNVNAFRQFHIDHTIEINSDKVTNIRKALDFSSDTCKFYLELENGKLFFYLGDKSATQYDNIRIFVADCASQVPQKAYDVDILKLVLKFKNDFSMKLNDNGVMYIEIENPNTNLKYITTPLVK